MIGKLFRLGWGLIVYGSIATVLSLAIVVGLFLMKHGFSRDEAFEVLTVLYKIDTEAIEEKYAGLALQPTSEQVSFEEVVHARLEANLDLDLRQQALDLALRDLRGLQSDVLTRQARLDQQSNAFDQRLAELEETFEQQAILELEQTLQAIQPRQAKEQLLLMLDDSVLPREDSMLVVVAVLKAMPLDKRKRILEEFKSEEEQQRLRDILRQIRLGEPDMSVIRQTRVQIEEFEPRLAEGQG